MLDGEEKKDGGGFSLLETKFTSGTSTSSTTMTPNPLAAASSSVPLAASKTIMPSNPVMSPSYVPAAVASSLSALDNDRSKTPIAPGVGSSVPNPIMMNNSPSSLERSPIRSTTPRMVCGTTNTTTSTATSAMDLTSPTLSPMASPIITTPSAAYLEQPPYDPPFRPGSTSTVGTSASTMDAIVASALEAPILEENVKHKQQQQQSSTGQRKRAHTIHWATSETTKTANTASRTHSPSATSLHNNETLQPVNFGDLDPPPPPLSVNFSPGAGGTPSSIGQRKLSNASSCNSAPSLGLRTASSNSLYSEYSCDSGSVGAKSMGSACAASTSAAATGATAARTGITAGTAATTVATHSTKPAARRKPADKRQKRLERNRESARASRRRRKHYLEELELKVTNMSLEMDRGRMSHACMAVRTVRGIRKGRLREAERGLLMRDAGAVGGEEVSVEATTLAKTNNQPVRSGIHHSIQGMTIKNPARSGIHHSVRGALNKPFVRSGIQHNVTSVPVAPLKLPHRHPAAAAAPTNSLTVSSLEHQISLLAAGGPLSRTSDELQIAQTFLKQQLSSLVQPTSTKFALWLSLQKDGFYRGGRSASERLSAARIGERLLHSGTQRAAPCDGMWPLVCHEIGLSYDQEERIRQCQRSVLANTDTWINRHSALATKNVLDSVHTAVGGAQHAAKLREKSVMKILTLEQRVKFLTWASRKADIIRRLAGSKFKTPLNCDGEKGGSAREEEYETSSDKHIAANMYIIDHRLSKVKQRISHRTPSFVHPEKLKKLSRRPPFESLAGQQGESDGSNSKLNREASFPSTGSLKRSLNDVTASNDTSIVDVNSNTGIIISPSSQNSGVTPESAYAAGQTAVMAALNDIIPIIPKLALHYSPSPHYVPTATRPLQAASLSSTEAVYQPQSFQSAPVPLKLKSQLLRNSLPQYPTLPLQSTAVSITAPSFDPDVVDIPMPTPVSVLLRTSDDFISELPYEEPLAAEGVMMAPPSPTIPTHSGYIVPEQATSSYADNGTTGTGLLLSYRHQSAPQLHHLSSASPSPDFNYSSLLPAAPMAMIPESSLVNNPIMGQVGGGVTDIGDFTLEDLPDMEADDWAIGEGFDMDVDQGEGTT